MCDELARLDRAESVTGEINLAARPGGIIEVEKQVANRPFFQRDDQRGHARAIVERNCGDLRDFEPARRNETTRKIFARKGQCARPRLILFLEGDNRAVAIEQEIQFGTVERANAASILSSPRRIASARSRTRPG